MQFGLRGASMIDLVEQLVMGAVTGAKLMDHNTGRNENQPAEFAPVAFQVTTYPQTPAEGYRTD